MKQPGLYRLVTAILFAVFTLVIHVLLNLGELTFPESLSGGSFGFSSITIHDIGFPVSSSSHVEEDWDGPGKLLRRETKQLGHAAAFAGVLNGFWAVFCMLGGMAYVLFTGVFDRFSLRLLFVLQMSLLCVLLVYLADLSLMNSAVVHPLFVLRESTWWIVLGWSLCAGVLTMAVCEVVFVVAHWMWIRMNWKPTAQAR